MVQVKCLTLYEQVYRKKMLQFSGLRASWIRFGPANRVVLEKGRHICAGLLSKKLVSPSKSVIYFLCDA